MKRRAIAVLILAFIFTTGLALAPSPAHADLQWYRDLVDKSNAQLEDAVRVIHILAVGRDQGDLRYEDRLVYLVRHGIVDLEWDLTADRPVTCGELAFMAVKTLGVRGGLSMFLLGANERYSYRECVDRSLVSPIGQEQYLSGEEILTFLRKARAYQAEHKKEN